MMTFMGLSKKLVHLSLQVVKKTRRPEKIIDQLLHSFLFPKLNINAEMADFQIQGKKENSMENPVIKLQFESVMKL